MKRNERLEFIKLMVTDRFWKSTFKLCDMDTLKKISESFLTEYETREAELKEIERLRKEEEDKINDSVNQIKETLDDSGLTIRDVYLNEIGDDDIYLYPTSNGLMKWNPNEKKRMPKELKALIDNDDRKLEQYKTKAKDLI
ncbi:hypothetical protein [Aliivibrio fischeri]|uniref:hypothetical protein n=1 Tax=Aliivibrio fischeri TaxID=668 RepID=UPI0007C506C2|nr:hypothetical protein [Aliivibrio fischeri]